MASQTSHHVLIFPFMAKGHTMPLLDLSKTLSRRGLKVSIVTTPSNSHFILQTVHKHSQIHLVELDFPIVDGLPKGCESTDELPSFDLFVPFSLATKQLRDPFERVLRDMADADDKPICVISDFFLGWTFPACREFGIPRLVFHGMGVFAMLGCKSVSVHAPHKSGGGSPTHRFLVPGFPTTVVFTESDLPEEVKNFDIGDPFLKFIAEMGESEMDSWGMIVNSFVEIEGDYVESLQSFYKNSAKAWFVGPLQLYDGMVEKDDGTHNRMLIEWLNGQSKRGASVIYVSFGTQVHVSDAQLDEVCYGLEMSGHPFVWVIRSNTWVPPEGMEERVEGRGLMIREWVHQRRILGHPAIGSFLSHCGWNSVLESLSMGVPILAWPMIAEQRLNAKFVVEILGAGEKITVDQAADTVDRASICKGVRELMGGGKRRRLRERAEELGRVARRAVEKGGSSDQSLGQLIDRLLSETSSKHTL